MEAGARIRQGPRLKGLRSCFVIHRLSLQMHRHSDPQMQSAALMSFMESNVSTPIYQECLQCWVPMAPVCSKEPIDEQLPGGMMHLPGSVPDPRELNMVMRVTCPDAHCQERWGRDLLVCSLNAYCPHPRAWGGLTDLMDIV